MDQKFGTKVRWNPKLDRKRCWQNPKLHRNQSWTGPQLKYLKKIVRNSKL